MYLILTTVIIVILLPVIIMISTTVTSKEPKYLRSPTWMLNYQRGNSFECASFLTSLLLARGYDAYVVSGYASREQTTRDLTRTNYPNFNEPELNSEPTETLENSKYKIKALPDLKSRFLIQLEEEDKRRTEEEKIREKENEERNIMEFERPAPDKYWGRRVHAWVVVLPSKNIDKEQFNEAFFIEPSTGIAYDVTERKTKLLYHGVESIWNDLNYWVNMQICSEACTNIKWELNNVELWEHLLPGEPSHLRGVDPNEDPEIDLEREKHLDMPLSYVEKIQISYENYKKRYPNGHKIMWYKKMKIELYTPCVQSDGLFERTIKFHDYDYTEGIEILEKFSMRMDNLIETKINKKTNEIVDRYKKGRPDGLKEHCYSTYNKEALSNERILEFFDEFRFDGLRRVEMKTDHLIFYYLNRNDLLFHREVEYSTNVNETTEKTQTQPILKNIVEKYHRNEKISADKDISIREFAIGRNEIRLKFHYGKDRFTRATRCYKKPSLADRERFTLDRSTIKEYHPDPTSEPERMFDLYNELTRHLKDEEKCVSSIKDTEREIAQLLETRAMEYFNPQLIDKTVEVENFKVEKEREKSVDHSNTTTDYLLPYLARLGDPTKISKPQAYLLEQECINDFKTLMIERKNCISDQLYQCKEELEKLTHSTVETNLSLGEENILSDRADKIQSKLTNLEIRLNRFRNLIPGRYETLLNMLKQSKYLMK